MTQNAADGVFCDGDAGVTIVNNTLSSNGEDGVEFSWGSQAGGTIRGNKILRNAGQGIGIWSRNHEGIIMVGNTISENALDGVHVSSDDVIIPTGVQISENQIAENSGAGITNFRGSAQIRGNLITGNIRGGWMGNEGTVPNLGTEEEPGNNAIFDNRGLSQLTNETPHEIHAVWNYWGPGAEAEGPRDLINFGESGGVVIFEPWLARSPFRKYRPSNCVSPMVGASNRT